MALFGKDEYLNKYFKNHYYIFMYDDVIRKLMIDYKFNEKPYIYRAIANFINKNKKIYSNLFFYDIIIPVPISLKRKKTRGYNQSLLIAKKISQIYNLNIEKNVLIKTKNNIAQSTLNRNRKRRKCCKCI